MEVKFLLNPLVFNYIIMTLYTINAVQFLLRRNIADGCYWLSALAITATVTFLYKH